MNDDKPGPVRVEEPQGYDRTPTERIPVAGDLSDARHRQRTTDDTAGDTVDGRHGSPEQEPVTRTGAPEPRGEANADGHDPLADRRAERVDDREMTTDRRALPTGGSGSPRDGRDFPGASAEGEHTVTETPVPGAQPAADDASAPVGLFEENAVDRFRDRWRELQADFVDDPVRAVRGADELVGEIMRELAERKQELEGRWRDGTEDTERLRVAVKEYRAFFNQLLNA